MRFTLPLWLALPLLAQAESKFPNCTSNANSPAWSLTNIKSYEKEDTWPDYSNATSKISFSLTSNVRPFVANCTAGTSFAPPHHVLGVWHPCSLSNSSLSSDDVWFTYDDIMDKIQINQTYTCWGSGGPTLIRYTAFGENYAALNCVGELKENPDWEKTREPQQTKFTDCGPVDLRVNASMVSAVA